MYQDDNYDADIFFINMLKSIDQSKFIEITQIEYIHNDEKETERLFLPLKKYAELTSEKFLNKKVFN